MHNPFTDTARFLAGVSPDYNPLGASRYLYVAFYVCLLAGSAYVAWRNWSRDPAQRTQQHVWVWLMRVVMAGLWYQGTFWKLPLPVSDAFKFWVGALEKFTSVPVHAALVHSIFLPGIAVLQPVVYLTEMAFTICLTLGVLVRPASIVAVLFTLHLWIGLYNDPTEWPWTYIGIIAAHGMFASVGAGRSLGIDNLWRRTPPAFLAANPAARRLFAWAV